MPQEHCAPVVGLVGGIGSGKSAVAGWVAQHASVVVLDGDEAGHRALEDPGTRDRVLARFPGAAMDADGAIDRGALAGLVFGDSDTARAGRADLEAILHPMIRQSLQEDIELHRLAGEADAILLDAAVLFEAGWDDLCDQVVYVDVPEPQRLARVSATRGWDESHYRARQASQWPLARKQAAANSTLDNSGPISQAGQALLDTLKTLAGDSALERC